MPKYDQKAASRELLNTARILFTAVFGSILLAVAFGVTVEGAPVITLPATVTTLAPGLHRLGTARHTVFGLHVFDATLWVAGPRWSPTEAHALDVEASRKIPPSRLVNGVIDEMRDIRAADDRQRTMWKQSLDRILPSLSRGDQLVILCLPNQQTVIFHNGARIGSLEDPNFGSALFRVWLDPMASRQDVRNALLQK